MIRHGVNLKNKVFYLSAVSPVKKKVLETMGVNVFEPPRVFVDKEDYLAQYMWALDFVDANR